MLKQWRVEIGEWDLDMLERELLKFIAEEDSDIDIIPEPFTHTLLITSNESSVYVVRMLNEFDVAYDRID